MLADDLGSALARERIAELRRQADAARLARAARRTRRQRRPSRGVPALADGRQPQPAPEAPVVGGGRHQREPEVGAARTPG